MSCVLEAEFVGNTYNTDHPRTCHKRAVGTATATTEASGFSASFANSPRLDNFWQPTALPATWTLTLDANETVSYFGIAAHDLGTQNAAIKVEYKLDAGSWTELNFGGDHEPEDNSAILFLFDMLEVSEIRLTVVSADAVPTIGVIATGIADEWPRKSVWTGTPITESDNISFANNSSDTGVLIGRTRVSDGLKFQVSINNLSEDWRKSTFKSFKAYANGEGAAFFIATRPGDYPEEVAYAWSNNVVMMSRDTPNKRVSGSVALDLMGYRQSL